MEKKDYKLNPKLLKASYILGLGLIALLSVISYLILVKSIKIQTTNGLIINASGRQRMLIQKVGGLLLESQTYENSEKNNQKKIELNETINLLKESHNALIEGDIKRIQSLMGNVNIIEYNQKKILSKEIDKLYFGTLGFDNDLNKFILDINTIINNGLKIEEEKLHSILKEKENLVIFMDLIVSQFQIDNELDIYKTNMTAIFIIILTLLSLFLEGILIFRPIVKNVINKHRNLEEFTISLENSKLVIEDINNRLEESNKTKNKFISMTTHELRTPLTAIRGYLSMILDGDTGGVNEMTYKSLEKVKENSDKLLQLVNEILDLKKMEASQMNFNLETIYINKYIESTVNDMKILSDEKGHILSLDIKHKDFELKTDPNKFKQILVNLISNAIKYTTKKGKIEVISWIENNYLKISVTDTGIGIEEKNIDKIFQEFGQISKTSTKNVVGTGLGLPIVKTMLEGLNGKIEIKSQYKKGSKFTANFPL